jgi:hypothetical protein
MSQHDEKEEVVTKGIDRREFIKRTAVGAGAVAATMVMGGCGSSSSAAAPVGSVAATVGPTSTTNKTAWKFGIMADTQWLTTDDGYNPNTSAISIINALNTQFINQSVKFVVQVGDHMDATSGSTEGGYGISTTAIQGEDTRALFAQPLYNAGIGFFPLRGNHDDAASTEFTRIYPQTQNGKINALDSSDVVYTSLSDVPATTLKVTAPANSGSSFTLGSNFSSPTATVLNQPSYTNNLTGLTYSFDVQNARFILIDQFTPADKKNPDGNAYGIDATVALQQPWISAALAGKPANGHAFVFGHKGLITQQHQDTLFGECPADANFTVPNSSPAKTITGAPGTNAFIRSMSSNGARLYFCGHDHIHTRSLVNTTDSGTAANITHILCQSDSSKFYTPNEYNAAGNGSVPPCTSNDAFYCGGKRQTMLSQELYTVGYYIVTVDGPNVSVDYYSAPIYATFSSGSENQILKSAASLNFTKRETFGYSQIGKQFIVGHGAAFTTVQDTGPSGTVAKILSGTNNNPTTDPSGRQYSNDVNTGWWAETSSTVSDILALWGMGYTLGGSQTDVYTLSLSYDQKKASSSLVLATPDGNGNWINAVEQNLGGAKTLVTGPWKAGYALGTYGIDAASGTVWAVINYNGYFAAVAGV